MKNIKKRFDYKNHIYISTTIIKENDCYYYLYLKLIAKNVFLNYTFSIPTNYPQQTMQNRLIYNLPKRKLLAARQVGKTLNRQLWRTK